MFRQVKRVPKCSGRCSYDDPDRQVAIVKVEEAEGGYTILYNCPNAESYFGKGCRAIDEWRNKEYPPSYKKLIEMEENSIIEVE